MSLPADYLLTRPGSGTRTSRFHSLVWVAAACALCVLAHAAAPGTGLWEVNLGGNAVGSPALGANGTVYMAVSLATSAGGVLFAVSPDGQPVWTAGTGGAVDLSSPGVGADGTIYLGTARGQLVAFTPDGKTNWVFRAAEVKPLSSPALGVDGTVYVKGYGQRLDRLYSVSPVGGTNWTILLGTTPAAPSPAQMSSPVIGSDGTIYVTGGRSNLYAISPGGSTNWLVSLGATTASSPALGADDTIYVGTDDNSVWAIDRHGVVKWRYTAPGFVESSPVVGDDGSVYVGYYKLGQGGLLSLTSAGELRWGLAPSAGVSATPALDLAGDAYVSLMSTAGLQAVSRAGSNLWSFPLTVPSASSSAVISREGTLYFGGGKTLYALAAGAGLGNTPWPMFRGDPQHTARARQLGITCSGPLPDGSVDLQLRVEVGSDCTVQLSTNLNDWSTLTRFSATNWNPVVNVPGDLAPQAFFRLECAGN